MKKIFSVIMMLAMLLTLVACGAEDDDKVITTGKKDGEVDGYYVTIEGVKVVPGMLMDKELAAKADSVFQAPSCAVEGMDNIYTFGQYEVTAFLENDVETVYTIYFTGTEATTDDGICLGDTREAVETALGMGYEEVSGTLIYSKGETKVSFIIENDVITSIEFALAS